MRKVLLAISLIVILGIWTGKTTAQETDFGSWVSFDVSKEVTKRFDIEFEEEVRIFKKFSEINRFSTTINGSYNVNKFLKGGAGYTWIYRHDIKDQLWENRHRYFVYLNGGLELGRMNFSLREKFQSTYYDASVPGFDYSPVNYLRSKLEVAWDLKGAKTEPYASVEMHYQLNNPDGNEIDNMRYTLGVDFPLSKKLDLDTYFRLNQDIHVKNPVNLYLLGINLKLKL
jgi:hypothetical protein